MIVLTVAGLFGAHWQRRQTAGAAGDSLTWHQLQGVHASSTALVFPPTVAALDGKTIHITGYIFPLAGAEGQRHFLLSATGPACPFCLPGGPADMMDVNAVKTIPYADAPVTITGTLHLAKHPGDGPFYALADAQL